MASTYSTRKTALDEIAARIQADGKRLQQARAAVATSVSDLTAMQSLYTEIIGDINTDAAANPSDQAYQLQKVEAEKLVAEFNSLKTQATATLAAIDGV